MTVAVIEKVATETAKPTRLLALERIPGLWVEIRAKHVFRTVDERSEDGSEELLSVSHVTGVTPRSEKNVTMFMAESYEGYKLCRPGDLVINSLWAWMRALGVSDYHGIVSTAYGVYRLRESAKFNIKYLDYLLRCDIYGGEYLVRSRGIWTSRLQLTDNAFFDVPILKPPREEQDAIVAFLDRKLAEIDRFIALKRRLIDLLHEQKAALISHTATKGRDPTVPMKDSGIEWLGQIPAHWETKKMKQVANLLNGYAFDSNSYVEEGIPIIRIGDVSGSIDWSNVKRAPETFLSSLSRFLVKAGDIILAMTGATIGKSAVFDSTQMALLNQRVGVIRAKNVHQKFLAYFIHSDQYKARIDDLCFGGAQENIGRDDLANIQIPVPPNEEQRQIVTFLDRETAKIDALMAKEREAIEKLKEYRTALIAEAVTGKIDVRAMR